MSRRVGDQNEKTKQWEKFVFHCMNGGLAKFQRELEKLSGKDYVTAFINILEFHEPKKSRVDTVMSIEDNRLDVVRNVITKSAS